MQQGTWDIVRGARPFVDDRRGIEFGGGFNNHNVEKLGITLNLRQERGKELLRELVAISDVGHRELRRRGAGAPGLRLRRAARDQARHHLRVELRVRRTRARTRRSRRGARSCRRSAGSRSARGLPDQPPAGWGYSYMDHMGGDFMAIAILAGLIHRNRTGEGQWVDMSCTEAGATLVGPDLLDYTVNGRPLRRDGEPDSNRSQRRPMAPHGIYPAEGDDDWVAIACRDDDDWKRMAKVIDEPWATDPRNATLAERARGCRTRSTPASARGRARASTSQSRSRSEPPGCRRASSRRPEDRIDHDPAHERVGPVAHRAPPRDGRRARRRHPGALLRHRLDDRARRSVPRRAQRPGVLASCSASTTPRSSSCTRTVWCEPRHARRVRCRRLQVVELASEHAALRGQAARRPRRRRDRRRTARRSRQPRLRPFADDVDDPERSLWWWHYNTSKRGVVLDLGDPGRRRRSAAVWSPTPTSCSRAKRPARWPRSASTTTSCVPANRAVDLGVGHAVRARGHARAHEPATDLTLLAGGGPVVELRLRRPHAPAGARRRQPGVPHRQHVGGDGRAHRGARSATSPDAGSTST